MVGAAHSVATKWAKVSRARDVLRGSASLVNPPGELASALSRGGMRGQREPPRRAGSGAQPPSVRRRRKGLGDAPAAHEGKVFGGLQVLAQYDAGAPARAALARTRLRSGRGRDVQGAQSPCPPEPPRPGTRRGALFRNFPRISKLTRQWPPRCAGEQGERDRRRGRGEG